MPFPIRRNKFINIGKKIQTAATKRNNFFVGETITSAIVAGKNYSIVFYSFSPKIIATDQSTVQQVACTQVYFLSCTRVVS